jgi:hypothetical protein
MEKLNFQTPNLKVDFGVLSIRGSFYKFLSCYFLQMNNDTINNTINLKIFISLNMVDIKNTLSRFKVNARSKIKNKTTNIKNGAQKFKESFSEAKNKSRSKPKSLLLSFTTVLSIFGVTLLASVLPAVAKDVPKNTPEPGQVCPSPTPQPALVPSQQISRGWVV